MTGRVKEFVRSERGSSKPESKGTNKGAVSTAAAKGSQSGSSVSSSSTQAKVKQGSSQTTTATTVASKVGSTSGKGSASSSLAQGAAVGTATTMGSVKPIIGKDKYVKTPKEAAAELSKKINKNSIIFETASKIGHIDLTGRSHFDKKTGRDIETPHIQIYDKNINPITGKAHPNKKTEIVLPATHNDIRVSRKLAKQKGLTNE